MDNGEMLNSIRTLENQNIGMTTRMGHFEETLKNMGSKVDRVLELLSRTTSRREFDPSAVLGFIKDGAILVGLVGAGILYMTNNTVGEKTAESREELAVMAYRIKQLEARIQWKAITEP